MLEVLFFFLPHDIPPLVTRFPDSYIIIALKAYLSRFVVTGENLLLLLFASGDVGLVGLAGLGLGSSGEVGDASFDPK